MHIVEQRSYYLKLESCYVVIIMAHNQLENSNMLLLGGNNGKVHKVEIDNEALRSFFNSELRLSQVPIDVFINNLVLFFENEAQPLLSGDVGRINELEKFDLDRSQKYTNDLLQRQNLTAADKAWANGNYEEFIKMIKKIDLDKVPSSYRLKYKIAQQRL